MFVPHEISFGEVFVPPLLVAGILGAICASITARILNKYRLSKHFFYPPLAMVGMMVIYTILIGLIFIPF